MLGRGLGMGGEEMRGKEEVEGGVERMVKSDGG